MARFINQVPLYYLAKELKRPLIGFDWGETGVGLCIVDVSQSQPRTFAIPLVESNPKVNYALTPLEMAIRDFCRALKPKGEKLVIKSSGFTQIDLPQVLRPAIMTQFDMASIVNDVAIHYDAVGYVFGYSADSRQLKKANPDNLRKEVIFQNFLKELDANGGLSRTLFTTSNEKNSTEFAKPLLANFPHLSSPESFLNSYHLFGMAERRILEREIIKYGITDSHILQKHLCDLRKSILDSLSAANFTYFCAQDLFYGKPYQKSNYRKEMAYLCDLAEKAGYPARDNSFLINGREDPSMECFFSPS